MWRAPKGFPREPKGLEELRLPFGGRGEALRRSRRGLAVEARGLGEARGFRGGRRGCGGERKGSGGRPRDVQGSPRGPKGFDPFPQGLGYVEVTLFQKKLR